MFDNKNTKTSTISALWTNSGESVKHGQSKIFRGWALAGIKQYSAYYAAIKIDRRKHRDFEVDLLHMFQAEVEHTDGTPTIFAPDGLPGTWPAHDLPWSSDVAAITQQDQDAEASDEEETDPVGLSL